MRHRERIQTKASSIPTNAFNQVETGMFRKRPFAVFAETETDTDAQPLPDLQTQLERGARFNQSLSRMKVYGNRPVIQPKIAVGAPGDRYEQEADQVAAQVMNMKAPTANPQSVQRQEEEQAEESLQMQPLAASITPLVQREASLEEEPEEPVQPKVIQRQEASLEEDPEEQVQPKVIQCQEQEDPLPTKPSVQRADQEGGFQATHSLESRLASQKGGGSPLSDEVRSFMEPRFGADFSQVRVHTDGEAVQMNRELNAQAFTHGSDIYFGTGKYNPESSAGKRLLAHELTHTIQQNGGGQIQRSVDTNGGTFDTTTYSAFNSGAGVGKGVGADINLKFTPNDLVEAETIGLTQTVKTLRSTSPGGGVNDASFVGARNQSLSLTTGDTGRAVDQGNDGVPLPNTNPLYAVENTPGNVSATLTDVGATPGFGIHGYRKRKSDGTFDIQDATLNDTPRRGIEFAGQEWRQTFEATALVLDGPLANTYLGSIEWGWKVDPTGNAQLEPNPIRLVRAGAPTSAFMDAAQLWNNTTLTDTSTGTSYNTVDLPITTLDSGSTAATNRTTADLLARIAQVDTALASIAAGTDRTNKEFEKRALEAELQRRNAKVDVQVISTEDWMGADEVYVKMTRPGGGTHTTPVRSLNDGDSHSFLVPLSSLLPLSSPVTVEVYDQDSPDADDLIVTMTWSPPFSSTHNTASLDDANYSITVQFER